MGVPDPPPPWHRPADNTLPPGAGTAFRRPLLAALQFRGPSCTTAASACIKHGAGKCCLSSFLGLAHMQIGKSCLPSPSCLFNLPLANPQTEWRNPSSLQHTVPSPTRSSAKRDNFAHPLRGKGGEEDLGKGGLYLRERYTSKAHIGFRRPGEEIPGDGPRLSRHWSFDTSPLQSLHV